MNQRC